VETAAQQLLGAALGVGHKAEIEEADRATPTVHK
jgi:hypothetical protein